MLAILAIVIGALTQLFVSGTNAQVDLTRRFEAQQDARLALDALRREIHCASGVTDPEAPGRARIRREASINITLGAACPTERRGQTRDVVHGAKRLAATASGGYFRPSPGRVLRRGA